MSTPTALELTDVATGLEFPEGPVSRGDGSFLLVQIRIQFNRRGKSSVKFLKRAKESWVDKIE